MIIRHEGLITQVERLAAAVAMDMVIAQTEPPRPERLLHCVAKIALTFHLARVVARLLHQVIYAAAEACFFR